MMILNLLVIFLMHLGWQAQAATILGQDCAGANLLCDGSVSCGSLTCKNGDELQGTFINVGLFSVGSGTTVFVAAGVPLAIYASTISIQGTINGIGRGKPGGSGGNPTSGGLSGFGADSGGNGGGGGGVYLSGVPSTAAAGGGGSYGGSGGRGADVAGGSPGLVYSSTGVDTSPISPDDIQMGSGGGGGAGSNGVSNMVGGAGGPGGGSVYLEASSITIIGAGTILVNGSAGTTVADNTVNTPHPAGGGGGSGGGILIRAPGYLQLAGSGNLSAAGGKGGDVATFFAGNLAPGGGGGGGRIKTFYRTAPSFAIGLSTAVGIAGAKTGPAGTMDPSLPVAGSSGTISFGVIASSPSGVGVGTVYITSIAWSWNAAPALPTYWGDAAAASWQFRIFPSTAMPPLTSPQLTAASGQSSATEQNLMPNTTYYRFVTSLSDWGDSLPSNMVSTHTLANVPGAAGGVFTSMSTTSLTLNWTGGSPANPGYTLYEVQQAADSAFSSPSNSFTTSLSSSPGGLSANTTYYFRAFAINLDGIPTPFTATFATATLAVTPSTPTPSSVFITSAVFSWTSAGNPSYTPYTAEISTDNFFTLVASSQTMATQAGFVNLVPGTPYFFRVKATNLDSVDTVYTTVISTSPGVFQSTNSIQPTIPPGAPEPDQGISYNGTSTFTWTAAQSAVGILDYFLDIGTTPGGNDFLAAKNVGNILSYVAAGLVSGKTYYARVQARNNSGVLSVFSPVGNGILVDIISQQATIDHPFNWPNPFDPTKGPTTIGFSLGAPADVTVTIYTLRGALVYTASEHFSGGGNNRLTWSGANDSGMRVSPGGYIAVIKKGYTDHTETQKFKIAVLY